MALITYWPGCSPYSRNCPRSFVRLVRHAAGDGARAGDDDIDSFEDLTASEGHAFAGRRGASRGVDSEEAAMVDRDGVGVARKILQLVAAVLVGQPAALHPDGGAQHTNHDLLHRTPVGAHHASAN